MTLSNKQIDSLAKLIEAINEEPGQGLPTREDWDRALDQVYGIPGTVFKVGDRVRLTGSAWASMYGIEVVIQSVDADGEPVFSHDGFPFGIYVKGGDDFSATLVEKARED